MVIPLRIKITHIICTPLAVYGVIWGYFDTLENTLKIIIPLVVLAWLSEKLRSFQRGIISLTWWRSFEITGRQSWPSKKKNFQRSSILKIFSKHLYSKLKGFDSWSRQTFRVCSLLALWPARTYRISFERPILYLMV